MGTNSSDQKPIGVYFRLETLISRLSFQWESWPENENARLYNVPKP